MIDFGDLFAGDPAVDLAAAWIQLTDGAAELSHETYGPSADAATVRRARGWAAHYDASPRRSTSDQAPA